MSRFRFTKEEFIEKVLVKDSKWVVTQIKNKLFEFGLKEEKCEVCGQEPIWQNAPLIMLMRHKNSDVSDSRLENLEIVCPNCFYQIRKKELKVFNPKLTKKKKKAQFYKDILPLLSMKNKRSSTYED